MHNNNNYISGYAYLKKLRTALAILQGTKLLSTLQQEAESTVSHDQTKRFTYLTMLFTRIHREMFVDWKEQATVAHRPGTITDAETRQQFRKTFARLVLDGDKNCDTALFDNNGFVIKTDNIAERLADFYIKIRAIRPFAYGNRITLDFFMTALGHLPAFKAVYEQGIDFRRLAHGDADILHDPQSSHRLVTQAFGHALDPTRTKSLQNQPNRYGIWPENKRFLSGMPFLSHRTKQGLDCLVTVNGGLVPVDSIREEYFVKGKHFADYPLNVSQHVVGYLPGTEEFRRPDKKFIDGINIGEDGTAPLFCLDVNMLTGLRSPSHIEFVELLKTYTGTGEKSALFKLANNEPLRNTLISAANGDARLVRTVEIAYERLGRINRILVNATQEIFAGKTPDVNPKLFMCMGGAGSGKTAVEEIAKAQCGDNYVVASLDEFRKVSDLYRILTAANHHSDDYVYVEPFANRLRDMVAQHAKEAGINLLYDGTGIPYQPRYSTIINQFKAAGFHTQITAVDAFLVKPAGREEELSRSGVIHSVKARFEKTGRALPWVITIDKHIRAPQSFLKALEDTSLDKIALFANDGDRDQHYLVAESFSFADREVKALQQHQLNGTLSDYLTSLIRNHNNSVLKNLAQDDGEIDALIERNPALDESNVAYQVYSSHIGHRVLAIYNTRRMVDFIEKRQLNPNASGEEGLLHKPEYLAFHVNPLSKAPWITRLQGSSYETNEVDQLTDDRHLTRLSI
ncbi:zeta toxin family protein [Methylomarinum vadi]|uniref:zeta toxin family protein n=1 Tax=Methylomarinum vadi TaxID=438855 RepID=UPI000A06000C|nr:zeta toxin family protein [Methylomarinum vadi]